MQIQACSNKKHAKKNPKLDIVKASRHLRQQGTTKEQFKNISRLELCQI